MAGVLVVPVSPWRAWSLRGLTAPFGRGTSWATPFLSKKVCRGLRGTASSAARQPHPSGRAPCAVWMRH